MGLTMCLQLLEKDEAKNIELTHLQVTVPSYWLIAQTRTHRGRIRVIGQSEPRRVDLISESIGPAQRASILSLSNDQASTTATVNLLPNTGAISEPAYMHVLIIQFKVAGFNLLVSSGTPKSGFPYYFGTEASCKYQCNSYCFFHLFTTAIGRVQIPLLAEKTHLFGNCLWQDNMWKSVSNER